ncbi:FtsX-like permease family protein [Phycisphaerae bacterium RAS1]|nr:FtsX-like permease family protein [Phycisphaerae bacterium RAS1]
MTAWTLIRRSLSYYWRQNLAVVLGTAVGAAVLSGALLVGDSMRGSLRDLALRRLGRIESAVVGQRLFSTHVADLLRGAAEDHEPKGTVAAVLALRGAAVHAGSGARDARVNIYGIDSHFSRLAGASPFPNSDDDRGVVLSDSLALEINARVGDDVLLSPARQSTISPETLLGRRDEAVVSLRLTVRAVSPAAGLGGLALDLRQAAAHNAFVPLETLQRAIDRSGRINAVFLDADAAPALPAGTDRLNVALEDYGLRFHDSLPSSNLIIESDAMLLPPAVETAVDQVAGAFFTAPVARLLTYLANEIRLVPARAVTEDVRAVPYSTVVAVDPRLPHVAPLTLLDGAPAPPLAAGDALLNRWTADQLRAEPGDEIEIAYYATLPFGRLEERTARFRVVGIVRMDAVATDPGFTPEYRGVTDAESLADWDPPFPMDLKKIRPPDEDYWTRYKAAPKVFVSLEDGRELWAHDAGRFGSLTSIRVRAVDEPIDRVAARWREEIGRRLAPEAMGVRIEPMRRQAIDAASGNTDFGLLFLAFSFFLIASGLMLVTLLFRLSLERRSSEIGLLAALGVDPRTVWLSMLAQVLALASAGAAIGQLAALLYAWLMLAGLRTLWSAAVQAPLLELHVGGLTLVIGFVAATLASVFAMILGLRGLTRLPPRALLSGNLSTAGGQERSRRRILLAACGMLAIAAAGLALASVLTRAVPAAGAFFGGGALALAAALCAVRASWMQPPRSPVRRPGRAAWIRLGIRNAPRHAGRSLLTVSLVASATFLIGSLQAFRLDPADTTRRESGSGGYSLVVESASPLLANLNDDADRKSLGLSDAAQQLLARAQVASMRLRPGDEASCLNLYRQQRPRIVGAPQSFLERGGFALAACMAGSAAESANPWLLLHRRFEDGAIPVIGDEAAVRWQMHRDLGQDLEVISETGRPARLRFVALLSGSVMQGELIVAEDSFKGLFPSISGYNFFLIDAPAGEAAKLETVLERDLASQGFDAVSSARRMAEYFAVQNTYLSTFQMLGALGLLLGAIGLAVVMLRNIVERRGELALLRALGFRSQAVGTVVFAENAALLATGLFIGVAAAGVAVAPQALAGAARLSWTALLVTPVATLLAGAAAGAWALRTALRAPLMAALRRE